MTEVYEAASDTRPVTITGSSQSIQFNLEASNEPLGASGYFSYDITLPQTQGKVTKAALYFDSFSGTYYSTQGIPEINLLEYPSGRRALAPGYYLVRVVASNPLQQAGWTEIVHIYSNMETKAVYEFTDDDFVDYITLSGTVSVSIDGDRPDFAEVVAYTGSNRNGAQVASALIEWNDNTYPPSDFSGTWAINLLPFNTPTDVYFYVRVQGQNLGPSMEFAPPDNSIISVFDQDIADIGLGIIAENTIALEGTVTVQINGSNLNPGTSLIDVSAYDNPECIGTPLGYGQVEGSSWPKTWSITMPAYTGNVYFSVHISDGSRNGSRANVRNAPLAVSGTSIPGIALGTLNFTILSGTVGTITVNGGDPSSLYIEAYTDPDGHSSYVGFGFVDSVSGWSMNLDDGILPGTTLYFFVSINYQGAQIRHNTGVTKNMNAPYSGINLIPGGINLDRTILSGTVGAVTLNGTPTNLVYINPRAGNNDLDGGGSADTKAGTWAAAIEPFAVATEVSFRAYVSPPEGGSSVRYDIPGVSITVAPGLQTIGNIHLGNIFATQVPQVTLSGTVGTITLNSVTQNSNNFDILAFDRAAGKILGRSGIKTSAWSIQTDAPAAPTTVTFGLPILYSQTPPLLYIEHLDYNKNATLASSDVGPVALGNITIAAKSVTVTVNNGGTPTPALVAPLRESMALSEFTMDDNMLLKLYSMPYGDANNPEPTPATSWTMWVPQSLQSCQFVVMTQSGVYITPSTVNISSGSVSLNTANTSQLIPLQ
jgi:hypothetical protein